MQLIVVENGKCLIYIVPFHRFFNASKALFTITSTTPAQAFHCVIPLWGGATFSQINSLGSIQVTRLPYHGHPIGVMILFGMHIFLHLPALLGTNFTPWWGEAGMEFTSYPRLLHSQPTGSTEIWTHNFHIQSPRRYPFCQHISIPHILLNHVLYSTSNRCDYTLIFHVLYWASHHGN